MLRSSIPLTISLSQTLGPLARGRGDPTTRVLRGEIWKASRTPDGAATVRFTEVAGGIEAEAWGDGAGWILDRLPLWCGASDGADDFDPPPGFVREQWRRRAGLRIPRTGLVTERVIPVILEQKVTGLQARRAYRRLTLALGETAPGPVPLLLPPDPARVVELPYEAFHPFGVERRRAEVVRAACARASWLDAGDGLPLEQARARLRSVRGIGPWTVAEVARVALGDADAVSVGDFHVPNLVAWALAGEPRGTDDRMLELLEPYRPQRGRAQRLIETSGISAPAFGPRSEVAAIERL